MNVQEIREFAATHAPVFVVGMERGGTSILTQTLATAPCFGSLQGAQETFVFDAPDKLVTDTPREMTRQYLGGPGQWRAFRDWYAGLSGWPEAWHPPRRIVSAYFYYASRVAHDDARILEKTPRHVFSVRPMLRFFPQARVIGILRNPFGVVESYRKRLDREKRIGTKPEYYAWLDRSPEAICAHIAKIAEAAHAARAHAPGSVLLVSYEEILRDPELVFGLIGDFAQIDGIRVSTVDEAPDLDASKSDPLLQTRRIFRGNGFQTSLDLETRLALVRRFPGLFARTTGLVLPAGPADRGA